MSDWLNNFGLVLHKHRVVLGVSQEKVARAADVTLLSYANYERGKSEPKAQTLLRLMKVLNIQIEELTPAPGATGSEGGE